MPEGISPTSEEHQKEGNWFTRIFNSKEPVPGTKDHGPTMDTLQKSREETQAIERARAAERAAVIDAKTGENKVVPKPSDAMVELDQQEAQASVTELPVSNQESTEDTEERKAA